MIHQMKLKSEPFYAIKAGFKSIELRLYDEKRQQLRVGDSIEFSCIGNHGEVLTKKIAALHRFESFEELYKKLPLLKCGYTPFTLRSADPKDMEEYYPTLKQSKYGVVGIELEEELLQRFTAGQMGVMPDCSSYEKAFEEIQNGRKDTHWIWYVFPQLKGLTSDTVTEYYALRNVSEAREYISHQILGARLVEISEELLRLDTCDPISIFGIVDAFKLRSCMTLFNEIVPEKEVFCKVLEKYCMGIRDDATLRLISYEK